MLTLRTLQPKQRKHRRRVGRGNASGRGSYSGRGVKGQRARTGGRKGLKLRGLRTLFRGIPKSRGFGGRSQRLRTINVTEIFHRYPTQNAVALHGYKVLGNGDARRPLHITAEAFSKSAKAKIEKAGGKTTICGKHF